MLFSGGLDSTTVLAIAKSEGFSPVALTVRYGQRHDAELRAAARIAAAAGVKHRTVSVDLNAIGGSALTDAALEVPKDRAPGEMETGIPITYVPARNTILLSIALGIAEVSGAEDIFVGVNAVDYSGYPDCRDDTIKALQAEIIGKGLALGVDYGATHSCYDPGADDRACGRCDACLIRKAAFESLGLVDPVLAGR